MKKIVQSSLAATALLLSLTSISVNAQKASQDSLRSARTESFSGTVTYDGSGAGTGGSEATYFGYNSGAITTGTKNAFFGAYSGMVNTTGFVNTFIGAYSGYANTTGNSNTFVGYHSGYSNINGGNNTFIGNLSGKMNTTGTWNTFLGIQAGYSTTSGGTNVFLGANAGYANTTGKTNVFVGGSAGSANVTGEGNVFLGSFAGSQETGSNKLYIANSNTTTPLIKGDFASSQLVFNSKVGVSTSIFPTTIGGVDVSSYKLFVKGGILAEEVRVNTGWADYVFKDNYKLKTLREVEDFITKNGHLPNVPSARQIESAGLNLGDISRIQQEKIEELTLHLISQHKLNEKQQTEIDELKALVKKLVDNGRK